MTRDRWRGVEQIVWWGTCRLGNRGSALVTLQRLAQAIPRCDLQDSRSRMALRRIACVLPCGVMLELAARRCYLPKTRAQIRSGPLSASFPPKLPASGAV